MGWGKVKFSTADQWFSKAVRLSNDYVCERCGMVGGPSKDEKQLQNCHIIGRRNNATRFSTWNTLCMCVNCHRYTGENVNEFKAWIVETFGQGRIDKIDFLARGILKPTKMNLKMVSDHYRKEFNRMTKSGDRNLKSWN